MLPKINRLTKDKEFDNVFKSGRSSYDNLLGIKAISNDLDYNRFGIMVSNKVSKKAVDRNKIKRRIREIIRLSQDKRKQGYDCVIISLPAIKEKSYQEIEQSIERNFIRLRMREIKK